MRMNAQDQFAHWLALLASEGIIDGGQTELIPEWHDWLWAAFQEWGAVASADLEDLFDADDQVLRNLLLQAARRLLPKVLADAESVGMTLDVDLSISDWGNLVLKVSIEPGGRRRSASDGPGVSFLPLGTDAQLLLWLAEGIQEVTMERDQVNVYVWPVCSSHQLGSHALLVDAAAVWWCKGGSGHVLAPIGDLAVTR